MLFNRLCQSEIKEKIQESPFCKGIENSGFPGKFFRKQTVHVRSDFFMSHWLKLCLFAYKSERRKKSLDNWKGKVLFPFLICRDADLGATVGVFPVKLLSSLGKSNQQRPW